MIDDVKKVLYVLDNFPKLSETFVLNELVALRKREIDVSIWAFRKSCDRIVNADFAHFGLSQCTYYIRSRIRLRILTNWRFYIFGIKLALIFFRRIRDLI